MIAITYVPKSCKIPVVATTKSAPRRDLTLFLTTLEFRTEKKGSDRTPEEVYMTSLNAVGFL